MKGFRAFPVNGSSASLDPLNYGMDPLSEKRPSLGHLKSSSRQQIWFSNKFLSNCLEVLNFVILLLLIFISIWKGCNSCVIWQLKCGKATLCPTEWQSLNIMTQLRRKYTAVAQTRFSLSNKFVCNSGGGRLDWCVRKNTNIQVNSDVWLLVCLLMLMLMLKGL